MTNGNLPSTSIPLPLRVRSGCCELVVGVLISSRTGILNRLPWQPTGQPPQKAFRGNTRTGTHWVSLICVLICDRKSKERRGVHATMLCQGARGLTRQGKRSLISARFFHLLGFIVTIPSLRRFASSTAINKLDVIMPAIEDFPARHIGKLTWKRLQ